MSNVTRQPRPQRQQQLPFAFSEDGDGGYPLEQCNECGVLVLFGDDLCGHCYREQLSHEEWESLHYE